MIESRHEQNAPISQAIIDCRAEPMSFEEQFAYRSVPAKRF
jgi:hypothetical protein